MMEINETHSVGLKELLLIISFVSMMFISGCDFDQTTATSTSSPVKSPPSNTPVMSSELIPTDTIEVESSPQPTFEQEGQLSTNGPWFVYKNIDGYLVAINSDGSSRILISDEKHPDDLVQSDGVYETHMSPSSSNGLIAYRSLEGDSNVKLTIMQLPNQELIDSFTLLSDEIEQGVLEIQPYPTQNLLAVVANTPVWSPSGKFLAFVAAIDGPTSDLYIYDISDNSVSRKTNDPDHIGEIHWSPDERLIYYESILGFDDMHPGDRKTIASWSATIEGSDVIKLLDFPSGDFGGGAYQEFLGWISDDSFVINITTPYTSIRRLLVVNASNGDYYELPYVGYENIALDPNTGTLMFLIFHEGDDNNDLKPGIYIGKVSGEEPIRIREDPASVWNWFSNISRFVLCSYKELSLASSDGNIVTILEDRCELPYPSPDGKFLGFREEEEVSIRTLAGEVIQVIQSSTISVDYPNDFYWLPNSSGFIFEGEENENHGFCLYMVRNIGDEPILIATDFPSRNFPVFYPDAVWIYN
jgi:hypothetical protein